MNTAVSYRKDIDGLRAIAVLSVVFFHAGSTLFPGGYVGVDVFFVISGYLISSIILKEIEQGRFDFCRFYERRIRRIFPALFFMLGATVILSGFFFTPSDYNEVGKSLYSVLLFFSNFHFLDKQGYFDSDAEIQIFLHTWSLSVEEQFYIVFPAFLVALMKCSKKWRLPLFYALFLASLISASVWVYRDSSTAFYMSPFRFWELMLGAVLALNYVPKITQKLLVELLAFLGFVMIILPVGLYSDETLFPGISVLPVCFGTALLIYTGGVRKTFISVFLGNPLLVFFGLISYSLYLWHWPLFVFREYLYLERSSIGTFAFVALSVGLAWFSWRFIERPFRSKEQFVQNTVFKYGLSATLVLLVGAAVLDISNGLSSRFPPNIQLLMKDAERHPKFRECGGVIPGNTAKLQACELGSSASNAKIGFALWGDSHAEVLAPGLDKQAEERFLKGYYFSKSACPPLSYSELTARNEEIMRCFTYHQKVLAFLESSDIQHIIIAAMWTNLPASVGKEYLKAGLTPVLERLDKAGKTVWFVHQVPMASSDVPRAMLRNYTLAGNMVLDTPHSISRLQQSSYRREIDDLRGMFDFRELDPRVPLCDELCRVSDAGRSLYKDDNHLSVYGSIKLVDLFTPIFIAPDLRDN